MIDRAAVDGPATAALRAEVKAALAAEGLTQAALAATLGMSEKHISQALSGRAGLSLPLAERMLAAMGRRVSVRTVPDTHTPQSTEEKP